MRPLLALTLGDPNGIGPEVTLKAAQGPIDADLVAVGSAAVLAAQAAALGLGPVVGVADVGAARAVREGLAVLDTGGGAAEPGELTAEGGRQAMEAVATAVDLAVAGAVDGIVTAPISKEAIHLAGYRVPGHTEFLQERTGAASVVMVLAADLAAGPLRVALVTIHVPVSAVAGLVTCERIGAVCRTLEDGLAEMGVEAPRLAVLGLNPHAGDGGVIGREEIDVIGPALAELRADGVRVAGPFPADAFFGRAGWHRYDAVVAMYHDQGLAPFKALAQGAGVNVTLGLPIVRTSPDHGTAFDVAGHGVADASSMAAAIRMAARMAARRAPR
ncbi:4-hydroxythreonine-4-phosphate dehydrogenase PdxA [Rubrivirga sp. IMCC43871]|uniref:4-hydroxythreonine-4-phosphate dehydrogenase PdxA n=1 Tax=Rubrivirga sp. IMCC43871 TaxID=3391575 RepID=UPI00398FAAAB